MRRPSAVSFPLLAVVLALGAGCKSSGHTPVQSLEASLDPLQARFNDEKGKLRFVALLSPT